MKINILLMTLILSGCVSSKTVFLPDGSTGYAISCDGAARTMGDCMAEAGKICGSAGYSVIDQSGNVVPFSIGSGSLYATPQLASGGYSQVHGVLISRKLFIKCK